MYHQARRRCREAHHRAEGNDEMCRVWAREQEKNDNEIRMVHIVTQSMTASIVRQWPLMNMGIMHRQSRIRFTSSKLV